MRIPTSFNMMGAERSFPPGGIPLTFTAVAPMSQITLFANDYTEEESLIGQLRIKTSIDNGETWQDYAPETTITLASAGDSVQFKNEASFFSHATDDDIDLHCQFFIEGSVAASGNMNSMINFGDVCDYCFFEAFVYCALTTAPELPSTTMAPFCYASMFQESQLVVPPALPATTLAQSCYKSMFQGTGITTAPALPATTLANRCYYQMFHGTGITTAPALPATTLANECYFEMFCYCPITVAPDLPASRLGTGCYLEMFYGCDNLSEVTVAFKAWSSGPIIYLPTDHWLDGVSATGIFRCPRALGTNETIRRGINYCPSGWTVVNTD